VFVKLRKRIRHLFNKTKEPYFSLYKLLGFYPENIHLYEQAFLHKSSSIEDDNGKWQNNERMEFLGDAILDAIVADIVYKHFQYGREGFLTNTRSKIVQRETLNRIAIEIGLHKKVVFSTKINSHNNYVYGNALEAFIGAVYLDQGYDVCYKFVEERIIKEHIPLEKIAKTEVNFKSSLIEWSQKNKLEISFNLIESFMDQDGNPVFQTEVMLLNTPIGIGIGYTKKESQQNASKMAIRKLRKDKEFQTFISEIKEKLQEGNTSENNFNELPDENIEADLIPNSQKTPE
jgi:ribonuclease-3